MVKALGGCPRRNQRLEKATKDKHKKQKAFFSAMEQHTEVPDGFWEAMAVEREEGDTYYDLDDEEAAMLAEEQEATEQEIKDLEPAMIAYKTAWDRKRAM